MHDEPRGDRITLTGMVFYGFHGVNAPERLSGQRFEVDLTVWLDLAPAGASDDVARTVNYSHLYATTREVVEGPPVNLIETVAARVAERILAAYPVDAVRVGVRKPWAPIRGAVSGVASVELTRRRSPGGAG